MNVYCFVLLLHSSVAVAVQMTGEIDIKLVPNQARVHFRGKKKADGRSLQLDKEKLARSSKTACVYQYPKRKQVDAMLSNTMNELTKIFIRVREYLDSKNAEKSRNAVFISAGEGAMPGDARDAKDEEKMRARRPNAHPPTSRFQVVSSEPQRLFDEIYSNMTHEYKYFYYNSSGSVLLRTGTDPCDHQEEIRQLWLDLLDNSQGCLRRAALRCVRLCLRAGGPRTDDARVKKKLAMLLVKEFNKLRSLQLHTLCDQFELCFKDL